VNEDMKHHFRLAYGVLALAFWLSVAGFIVLITRQHNGTQQAAWSAWRPTAQGLDGAQQIAQRVSRTYKSDTGTQLAAVQGDLPYYQGTRVAAVGVRALGKEGQVAPYINMFGTDRTLIYSFCVIGANCSLPSTSDGAERSIRREALELSLYAFKYLKNVDQVVSLVQTVKQGGTSAIFLRKNELKPELDHPLRNTLPLTIPPVFSDKREQAVIDELTLTNTLPAHYESLPDGDSILVLDIAATAGG
jgi:hypothetical protein